MQLKCPANVVHEKEWRANNGNRCNAIFLSNMMHDGDSMRKLFHNRSGTYGIHPIAKALWKYYKDHDKEALLDKVEAVTTDINGYPTTSNIWVERTEAGRFLLDISCSAAGFIHKESDWADWRNYERRGTVNVCDDFSSRQSVYYDNKSVAEVLQDTVQKNTYLHEWLKKPTGNDKLDLLLVNLEQNRGQSLHIQTYYQTLKVMNDDLQEAFEGKKAPLDEKVYVPAIIMLDDMANEVFNQMDYKQQRVFHKSDLGQEILRFSYLTTQNLRAKDQDSLLPPEYYFDAAVMHNYLADIKNTDLWQVAARKIATQILAQQAPERRLRVGSPMNNRLFELATLKARPKESMYAGYWQDDANRIGYMNLYVAKKSKSVAI